MTILRLLRQAAALPVRAGRVCLVTNRSGRRWVIPKGRLEPGATPGEIALVEAWEEGGLVGVLAPEPLGTYRSQKGRSTCLVTVFLLEVLGSAAAWPEAGRRRRCWLPPGAALQRLDHPGLRGLLARVLARPGLPRRRAA